MKPSIDFKKIVKAINSSKPKKEKVVNREEEAKQAALETKKIEYMESKMDYVIYAGSRIMNENVLENEYKHDDDYTLEETNINININIPTEVQGET